MWRLCIVTGRAARSHDAARSRDHAGSVRWRTRPSWRTTSSGLSRTCGPTRRRSPRWPRTPRRRFLAARRALIPRSRGWHCAGCGRRGDRRRACPGESAPARSIRADRRRGRHRVGWWRGGRGSCPGEPAPARSTRAVRQRGRPRRCAGRRREGGRRPSDFSKLWMFENDTLSTRSTSRLRTPDTGTSDLYREGESQGGLGGNPPGPLQATHGTSDV